MFTFRPMLPPSLYDPIHDFWESAFDALADAPLDAREDILQGLLIEWEQLLDDQLCPEDE